MGGGGGGIALIGGLVLRCRLRRGRGGGRDRGGGRRCERRVGVSFSGVVLPSMQPSMQRPENRACCCTVDITVDGRHDSVHDPRFVQDEQKVGWTG